MPSRTRTVRVLYVYGNLLVEKDQGQRLLLNGPSIVTLSADESRVDDHRQRHNRNCATGEDQHKQNGHTIVLT